MATKIAKKKTAKRKTGKNLKLTLVDLYEDPRNPRTMSDEARKGLQHSIDKFGDISGIVFNQRTGYLVAGHQRLAALRKLYKKKLKVTDNEVICPNGVTYPIRIVDWEPEFALAANIAANSQAISGEFTEELDTLLAEARDFDPETFSDVKLDDLIIIDEREAEDFSADDYDEVVGDYAKEREVKLWLYFEPRSEAEMEKLRELYGMESESGNKSKRILDMEKLAKLLLPEVKPRRKKKVKRTKD